jgi:unsaturated rhamnogalacturonyl hydrolase
MVLSTDRTFFENKGDKMKKIFLLLMVSLTIFMVGCSETKEKKIIEESMNEYVDSLISSTTSYIPSWNKEGFKGRWNYIDGVFLNSIVSLYEQTNNEEYKDFLINYIDYYIDDNGVFIHPKTKEPNYKTGELDSVCCSKILFDAYEYTNDSRYEKAIKNTYNQLFIMPKAEGTNNFWHKTSYQNQIWLDGMYMYAPFYARYAKNYTKDVETINVFGLIKEQYEYIRNNMFNEELGLYYHGHDSTKTVFWADKNTGNSSSFWLRSMGWYLVSLVDVLEYFPEGNDKVYLTELLKEGIDGVLKYIDEDSKMFYQLVNLKNIEVNVKSTYLEALKNTKYMVGGKYVDTTISNYLESSGSSMMAYCLLKGSRLGIYKYQKLGKQIFEGIYNHSFKNNKLNDICITAGLGPEQNKHRDGSNAYYLAEPVGKNDAKGVGPFIMAYLEYIR